jgi:hypothetical protein
MLPGKKTSSKKGRKKKVVAPARIGPLARMRASLARRSESSLASLARLSPAPNSHTQNESDTATHTYRAKDTSVSSSLSECSEDPSGSESLQGSQRSINLNGNCSRPNTLNEQTASPESSDSDGECVGSSSREDHGFRTPSREVGEVVHGSTVEPDASQRSEHESSDSHVLPSSKEDGNVEGSQSDPTRS